MEQILIPILVLGLTGFAFSLLLALLSKKLKVEEDPRAAKILELLPGLNCGACGFSGCRAYAEAVVNGKNVFSGCLPAGDQANKQIAKTLDLTSSISAHKQTAICHCGAKEGEKKASSRYLGPNTCKAAHLIGGAIDCAYGCLGFGDCIEVCPVGAITLKQGLIHVDIEKCGGCEKCVQACPRNLFEIVPIEKGLTFYNIACANKDTALEVKKVCSKGCISCTLCTRVEDSPYRMKDNLSAIDYTKENTQETLEAGKNKCPTKCIVKLDHKPQTIDHRL